MREDAEALRRRLYAPGASEADVERYRDVEPPPAESGQEEVPTASRPGRRRFLLPMTAVVVAAVLAAGVTVARLTAASQHPVTAPTALAMTTDDREEIEAELADDNAGGIAAFLVTHTAVPSLLRATRLYTLQHAGVGDGTVELAPVPAEAFQGRATVLLVLQQGGDATWTALRRRVDPTGEQQLVAQRTRGGHQEAGILTTDTFRYASGDRPVELRVQAAPGAHWGVAVVFSD